MRTLLVDLDQWDLLTDAAGNIAVASEPYALAQDVASAVRTFLAEVYYDTTLGIPYLTQVLGQTPPVALLQALVAEAALTVPGVVSATCTITGFLDRAASGQVTFTDSSGRVQSVAIQ